MPIVSQYIGATRASLGASFLDTRAILHIEEGYDTGSTIEYVHVGDYEVDDISGGDVFSTSVNLSATNKLARMSRNSLSLTPEINSIEYFTDSFDSQPIFESNFQTTAGGIGITSGGWATSGGNVNFEFLGSSEAKTIVLNTQKPTTDFRTLFTFTKGSATISDAQQFEVDFRKQDEDNTYRFIMGLGGSAFYYLLKYTGGSASVVGSAIGASLGTGYAYGMLVARGGYMYFAQSDDAKNYQIKLSGIDQTYSSGSFSIGARAQATATWSIADFSYSEIGDRLTTNDALLKALSYSGIDSINFQNNLDGFDSFVASVGTSVTTGITNSLYQANLQNMASGSSWHTFIAYGTSIGSDFKFECEVKGVSGNYAGILYGTSNNFVTNAFNLGPTNNDLIENYVAGTRNVAINVSAYLNLKEDMWYDMKFIKQSGYGEWFVNNTLAGKVTNLGNSGRLGFAVWRNGASGTQVNFRNPRLYDASEVVSNVSIDPNVDLSSVYSRYASDGLLSIVSGNTVNIFDTGASRGLVTVNSNLVSTNTETSNNASYDAVTVSSDVATSTIYNSNDNKAYQLDSDRSLYVNEPNVSSTTEASRIARRIIQKENRDINRYTLRVPHNPVIELHDRVGLVDTQNGISYTMVVTSLTKSYSVNSGYRTTLLLAKP